MILPIGHEESSVRRLPWVSFAVMALCVLAFLVTKPSSSATDEGGDELWAALEYYFEHPYLELDPTLEEAIGASAPEGDAFFAAARESIPPPMDEADVEAEHKKGNVEWLGHLPLNEVLSIVGDATMLVMPSVWYETFGRTIAEAFARGTPVVASDMGAMAELVEDCVVDVARADRAFCRAFTSFVCCPDNRAAFDAAACHHHGQSVPPVVATWCSFA